MAVGTVKIVLTDKGYGFVTKDGAVGNRRNGDVFFHESVIADGGIGDFHPGDRVVFEEEPDPQYPIRFRASAIRRLQTEPQQTQAEGTQLQ